MALEEISNKVQEQASTALEEISSPIQDQASTALGSTSTLRDFKTHLLHVTNTCIRRALKWGHLVPKNQESSLRSSFIVHPKIKPKWPFGSTIIHQFKIKPRRPLKKVFFVLRSSFFQDQAPTTLGSTSHRSSRSSPKALEDPFITVLQDQAQKPLKIRSSPLFKIKPQTALEETLILKIKPQRLLEDPLKSTFKDQAHGP
ncbi:hypothetical protein ACFX10_016003 [Malus domestica]